MTDQLNVIKDAALTIDRATARRNTAIGQALQAGVPVAHIADAAHISRQAVYKMKARHFPG